MGRVWCRGPAVHLDADFTEAERLLMLADCHTRGVTDAQKWTLTLTAAQVHATLALAAATAVGHCTSPLKLACASYLTGEPDVQS